MIIDLLRSNGSIVVNKRLAHAIGIDAAIMYSELISKQDYFKGKNALTDDGYFFNTVENMMVDTTLTKYQQSKAIKKLVELKLIFHDNRGLPQRRFFKINNNEKYIKEILEENNLTFKSEKTEQLIGEKVDSNNTKQNNIKNNNKIKNIYIISDENDAVFSYYSQKYKEHFNKEHPTLNKEKRDEILSFYYGISADLDIEDDRWLDLVEHHFENLSSSNDGNILSFLASNGGHGCIYRYLEETES